MNEKLLKSEHRKEQILLTALTIPALISITLIIVIPVGWLFSLSFIGKTGDFSFENYQKMVVYKSYFRVFKTTFNASISLYFTDIKPGVYGPKLVLASTSFENEIIVVVRP